MSHGRVIRRDIRARTYSYKDASFDGTLTPQIIASLRHTGLGFTKTVHGKIKEDTAEADDLDVGPIGALALDLDI